MSLAASDRDLPLRSPFPAAPADITGAAPDSAKKRSRAGRGSQGVPGQIQTSAFGNNTETADRPPSFAIPPPGRTAPQPSGRPTQPPDLYGVRGIASSTLTISSALPASRRRCPARARVAAGRRARAGKRPAFPGRKEWRGVRRECSDYSSLTSLSSLLLGAGKMPAFPGRPRGRPGAHPLASGQRTTPP